MRTSIPRVLTRTLRRVTKRRRSRDAWLDLGIYTLNGLLFGAIVCAMSYNGYQKHPDYGPVGILGAGYAGQQLDCGGTYNPAEAVIADPFKSCGDKVVLINPVNGKHVAARVVSTRMALTRGRRFADVSPAVAVALGLNPNGTPQPAVIRQANGWKGFFARQRLMADTLPKLPAQPMFTPAEQRELAENMLYEGRGQGRLGMLAVGLVTLTRLNNGSLHTTVSDVINQPYQFSWKLHPQREKVSLRSPIGHEAMQIARRLLTGQLRPDELALAAKLQGADHYYALSMARPPYWTSSMDRVQLSAVEEKTLGHAFYRPATAEPAYLVMASR